MQRYMIDGKDRMILRELAKKQYEYSQTEKNKNRIREWADHNSLQGKRPMIHLELWTFAQEIIPQRLQCKGEFARDVETKLYCNFLNQELFDDDRVTPDYYPLPYDTHFTLFNIPIKKHNSVGSVGHEFISVVEDLEDDYEKLQATDFGVDMESTMLKKQALEEAFGDILPVRVQMDCLYSVPTQMIVHFMKMENMMFNIYDYPELFKGMMNRIADDTLAYYRMLEEKHLILPTTGGESLGQGSWCYNHELPGEEEAKIRPLTTRDVWGFMDSQETVGLSPEMFEEFIFPCYKKISEQYGLLSYGCCEPVDPIWENCISKLENLRKVSISPWCNEEYMGERLKGSKTIFHRKPSPNYLGVGTVLDEEAVRESIRKTMKASEGCKLEITQRDVYTINKDTKKAKRYVDIIKAEAGL
ncbi:hypothetical protein GCM10008922_28500 [Faecalicatena contorta]|uniref:hypothetical protein n=1 Tax=Faecalicatena contorta TaxID=39482 RepID=UPI0031D5B6B6